MAQFVSSLDLSKPRIHPDSIVELLEKLIHADNDIIDNSFPTTQLNYPKENLHSLLFYKLTC